MKTPKQNVDNSLAVAARDEALPPFGLGTTRGCGGASDVAGNNVAGKRPVANPQRERGMAVMLSAFMLLFTIPIVGLSVDAGLLFLVRAKLSSACDAASLATARNMNLGQDLSSQMDSARQRGERYFHANFPNGYLGATVGNPTVDLQLVSNTIQITTNASVRAPLYFATFIGPNSNVTGAVGQAARRDINMMLVLDRSGSMSGTPCTVMKDSAKEFVNMFANDRDYIGLVTYGGANYLVSDLRNNFKSSGNLLTDQISSVGLCGVDEHLGGIQTGCGPAEGAE